MQHDVNELRGHLFDALQGLKNGTLDIAAAKTMSEVAQTIINSAKVEVDYLKISGNDHSAFLDAPQLPDGVTRSVVHRIR